MAVTVYRLALSVDTRAAQCLISELARELLDAGSEVRDAFLRGFETIPEPFRFDSDGAGATRADQLRVVLQPSKRLLELVAALRAGQLDIGGVEVQKSHG